MQILRLSDADGSPIWVVADKITTVTPHICTPEGAEGCCRKECPFKADVFLVDGDFWEVVESAEDILTMLGVMAVENPCGS